MRFLSGLLFLLLISAPSRADLQINEISATHSDRLLVREPGEYPRVGNTIPWQDADYDDSNWRSGNGPFGFGTSVSPGTNVAGDIQNFSLSLYLRKTFSVSAGNAASNATLQLDVRHDDGFIAFLNGVEVARRNMGFPGMFAYRDQPAYNANNSTAVNTINLGTASSLLQEGDNLLCIQVHNQTSSGGGDILLSADLKLSGGTIMDGDTAWRYFGGLAEPAGGLVDYGLLKLEAQQAPDVLWATPSFDDLTVVVESSMIRDDWTSAIVLFSSAVDSPPVANEQGRIRIVDSRPKVQRSFHRVRVVQN